METVLIKGDNIQTVFNKMSGMTQAFDKQLLLLLVSLIIMDTGVHNGNNILKAISCCFLLIKIPPQIMTVFSPLRLPGTYQT